MQLGIKIRQSLNKHSLWVVFIISFFICPILVWAHLHKHLIVSSALVYFVLHLIVPPKDEEEVVEEMETSTSLEEDSIPVISRSVSYEIYF